MFNKLIKITFHDYKVMGHPVCLKHRKYPRGDFIFNLCFVVSKDSTIDCIFLSEIGEIPKLEGIIYAEFDTNTGPVIRYQYLVELERECWFLSGQSAKKRMPRLVRQIFKGINDNACCEQSVTKATSFYLKLCPSFHGKEPPKISKYMVPMFTRCPPPISPAQIHKMDILSQKIVPHIDGVRCIKEISNVIEIEADLVERCIQNLHFYGCITLVPLFMYSNTYVTTEKLHKLYEDVKMQQECLEFIKLNRRIGTAIITAPPTFPQIFRLYASLKTGYTLKEWVSRIAPDMLNFDVRKFIQFGLCRGFVRKLSVYPFCKNPHNESRIASFCNGSRPVEDIAIHYRCSPFDLLSLLQKHKDFVFISK
uniref:GATOR complex protein NPRL2 n=1 Tax=Steinernema glaseri TaxID=37863 RepID=A0A1I7Z545_9BILA